MRRDPPIPGDVAGWLALWEAWLHDRDNDELAGLAGGLLLDILDARGVTPCERQRPDKLS